MNHKFASRLFIALSLSLLIVVSLTGCSTKFARLANAPTVPCQQPPAQLLYPYPDGADCHGTVPEKRTCYGQQTSIWAIQIQGLYQAEVQKRSTEDQCLDALRRDGVIR